MALNSVLEAQKAIPVWRIFSGFGPSVIVFSLAGSVSLGIPTEGVGRPTEDSDVRRRVAGDRDPRSDWRETYATILLLF
jgi:hypothetical protein